MLQFRKGSKAQLDLGRDFPIPIFPKMFLFFSCRYFDLGMSFPIPIFLRLLLYPFTHYYLSLITLADLGMGFPQPRISFCACSRTRSPLGGNVGRIQMQFWKDTNKCWKDTNTMLEGYTHKLLTSKENASYLYHVEPVLNALVATQVEFAILWLKGYSSLN